MEAGIRAHHLDYLQAIDNYCMQYEQAGHTPQEARSIAEAQFRDRMQGIVWELSSLIEQDPENRDSYIDIVGTDRTQVFGIARGISSALLGIYRLNTEDVHIHGGKDGICRSCAVGSHCEEETFEYEMQYMRDIIRVADNLDLPYEVTEDGKLVIAADVLKRVLRSMNEDETNFTYANEMMI